ncbi:MAG: glycosyltransferase family 2 protein [Bacteroidota bacterium]
MSEPLISILMPVYNAEPYLSACLDSICKQSYQNWELVAVTNGSTDASYETVQRYQRQDARIRVFNLPEKGIILALRKAYAESRGEWITRMDADDKMPPQKLETLLRGLNGKAGRVATGLVEYFSDEGPVGPGFIRYSEWLNQLTLEARNWDAIYEECVIASPCWMMHRSDLNRIGAFESDRYPEDYDLVFRMYKVYLEVVAIPEVLHLWRDHGSRASRTDPNYQDQQFLELKLDYFFKLDRDRSKGLLIWGAGKKAKKLVNHLIARNEAFVWTTENPKKQEIWVYERRIRDPQQLKLTDYQIMVAVSSPTDLDRLREKLSRHLDVIYLYG